MKVTRGVEMKIARCHPLDIAVNVHIESVEGDTYYDPDKSMFITPTTLTITYDLERTGGLNPPEYKAVSYCDSHNFASKAMLDRMNFKFAIKRKWENFTHRLKVFLKKIG